MGYTPGDAFWHDHLRKQRPIYALARQWAGHEAEVAQFNREISRLQRLVTSAVHELRKAGPNSQANRLERAMQGK